MSSVPTTPVITQPDNDRRALRFVAFGLAILIAISGLTARLFYLQVSRGPQFAELAETNRSVLQSIPSTRGLIYDRMGRPLVMNEASFSVKIRPADLPFDQRPVVVQRLAALLHMDPTDINAAIDANPGSSFDLVRIAQDVPRATADFIAESHIELPGVEVVVETQRDYTMGTLMSHILGYTGAINSDELKVLKDEGYLPDDMIGKAGVEATYEAQLRGTYGIESVERDATGRKIQVLETVQESKPGNSLRLTIDTKEQKLAQKALEWGLKKAGLKRGVFIAENPQTGEILAMVSLPTYDNNDFADGISKAEFKKLVSDPDLPLTNEAIQGQFPPGSTFKLVTGTGGLADRRLSPSTELVTRPYLKLGSTRFWDWNHAGFGRCNIYCGFGHSSDTFFFQVAGMLGIDRLAYWAHQYGFGVPTGIDLPGEVRGIVPSNDWKIDTYGEEIFPGEVYQAGIGQGYDAVTPLQLINAYSALVNGGKLYQPRIVRDVIGPDGKVAKKFKPHAIRRLKVPAEVLRHMRHAARQVILYWKGFHIFNLPMIVAGKSGTAEFGKKDAKGRLPYHSWFVGFVPKNPHPTAGDPQGFKAAERTDSNLVILAFAYDSRTVGNAASEIAKYYLQMRYKLKGDYRNPERLARGNFYEGN